MTSTYDERIEYQRLPITLSDALLPEKEKETKSESEGRKGGTETVRLVGAGYREIERGEKIRVPRRFEVGTRVASAERCVRYLRGSQPAGIVIV